MSAINHRLGQVTYPRMERQDLTQSQLGSFKFTPTDEVHPQFTNISNISHCMGEQRTHPFGKASRCTTLSPGIQCSTFQSFELPDSPTRFDATFFNTYIKPDLANSRLKLGPNALRVAVDRSPTSPRRQALSSDTSDQFGYLTGAQSNTTAQSDIQNHRISHSKKMSDLNPAALEFAQSDTNMFHTSLIRALATEQQAHQVTKLELELERQGRIMAEAETQKQLEQNRSLLGSITMLKGIVQHSLKKEQGAVASVEYERFQNEVEAAVPATTILHDAVKNLGKPTPRPAKVSEFDSDQLFNFDLIHTYGSPALARHFSYAPPEANAELSVAEIENDSLISITPEKVARGENSDTSMISVETDNEAMPIHSKVDSGDGWHKATFTKANMRKSVSGPQMMAMPFDAHVQWSKNSIFENEQDKLTRLRDQSTLFAEHPVRYFPNKADKNLYRTVMIDFIPIGTTYKEVLGGIRGGPVESVHLYGPTGKSTSFMTARVIFNFEREAQGVYKRGQNPGIMIGGKRVRVWQVLEATYPRSEELEKQIFDESYTRFLLIQNAIEPSLAKLPQKLAKQVQDGSLIEITTAIDGLPLIEFNSVAECAKALDQLMKDPDFGGSLFDFEDDPCCNPY